jgi:hypothetical protein
MNNEEAKNKVSPDAKRIVDVLSPEKALLLYTYRQLLKDRKDLTLGTIIYRFSNEDPQPEVIRLLEELEAMRNENSDQFNGLCEAIFDYLAAKQNKARGGDLTYSEIKEVFLKQNKLLEVVVKNDNNDLAFAIYDPARGKLEIADMVEIGGKIVEPPKIELKYLPSVPQRLSEDPTLWRETRRFIRDNVDLPDEALYDVLTAFVALSWFYDAPGVDTVPILFLHGPHETGKSRTLEVLETICRSGAYQGCVTGPSLFHFIEAFKPTVLLDFRFWKDIPLEVFDLLSHCYRRGLKIFRVIDPSLPGERGLRSYDVYSLVGIVAHDEPPLDIMSRAIKISMQQKRRLVRSKINSEEAARLRTRWLAQRFRHFFTFVVWNTEYKSDSGRLSEIISPLLVCAHVFGGPEAEESIRRYADALRNERKVDEATSIEAQVLSALVAYIEQCDDAPECVAVSELVTALNNENANTEEISPQLVGKVLSRLGFKKTRINNRRRGFLIDYDLLNRLKARYLETDNLLTTQKSGYIDDWLRNDFILPSMLIGSSRGCVISPHVNDTNDTMAQSQNSGELSQSGCVISHDINDTRGGPNDINHTTSGEKVINPASQATQPPTNPLDSNSSSHEKTAEAAETAETSKPESNSESNTSQTVDLPSSPPSTPQAESRVFKGLDAARDLLKSQVESLPDAFRLFIADYSVDQWGYANIRCQCGSNFGGIDDFVSHVRAGSCSARRCSCGDNWLTLSELVEHCKKTGCQIDPNPPPDPPEKKTKRHWRRLHRNGDYFEVSGYE